MTSYFRKEAKEKELKSKAAEQRRLKEQKELEIQSEKYKKEKDYEGIDEKIEIQLCMIGM